MKCNKCYKVIPKDEEHFEGADRYTNGGYYCSVCFKAKQGWTSTDTVWLLGILLFLILLFLFIYWLVNKISKEE